MNNREVAEEFLRAADAVSCVPRSLASAVGVEASDTDKLFWLAKILDGTGVRRTCRKISQRPDSEDLEKFEEAMRDVERYIEEVKEAGTELGTKLVDRDIKRRVVRNRGELDQAMEEGEVLAITLARETEGGRKVCHMVHLGRNEQGRYISLINDSVEVSGTENWQDGCGVTVFVIS